jgi:hypothetical protein
VVPAKNLPGVRSQFLTPAKGLCVWYRITQTMSETPVSEDDAGAEPPARSDAGPAVEAYEAEDGVVLYDAENPLAWLKGSNASPIEDAR